jgi:hypothetical protein
VKKSNYNAQQAKKREENYNVPKLHPQKSIRKVEK